MMIYSQNEPVLSGTWGASKWEMYVSDKVPEVQLCTAVGCVAIVDAENQTVAMTRNIRSKDSWELPAGHIESGESLIQALHRETFEETGLAISDPQPFAYRKISRSPDIDLTTLSEREKAYPNPSYLPYFYTNCNETKKKFTGEEVVETQRFTLPELENLHQQKRLATDELTIVKLGLAASQSNRTNPI